MQEGEETGAEGTDGLTCLVDVVRRDADAVLEVDLAVLGEDVRGLYDALFDATVEGGDDTGTGDT